jgi:arylsulfatase A-like enzyme
VSFIVAVVRSSDELRQAPAAFGDRPTSVCIACGGAVCFLQTMIKLPRFLLEISFLALVAAGLSAATPQKPNIIFILTDDQGYGDISAHGNPILRTPNLDRLRSASARFTDFHVSPTCAPTRSALLTGRHEFKNGVTHTIFERERLTTAATTLPEMLKGAGYTTGIFGKWHLGDEAEYQPNRRGFDEVFIHGGGGIGQTYPGSCGDAPGNTYFNPAILHNGKFVKTEGYCTDVFFAEATRWIDSARQRGPFFAYIATNAPHSPYTARPEDAALYRDKVPDDAVANFFGMVHNIDENVGRLLARVDEWGLTRDTLVVFMNDNGGTAGTKVFNAGMRAQKGTPYLGGTRAAAFWRWPGQFTPADIPALTAHIDFLPTLADIIGVPLNAKLAQQIEGRSLLPLLKNNAAPWPERTLFTHVGRWTRFSDPQEAKFANCSIRTPKWHLVSTKGGTKPAWELYDVAADPAESASVAAGQPETVAKLAAAYDQWWTSVQPALVNEKAIGPRVNPFKELYWRQFGGGPSEEDLNAMDPKHTVVPGRKDAKKKKK